MDGTTSPIILGAGKMAELLLDLHQHCGNDPASMRLFDDAYLTGATGPGGFPIHGSLTDGVHTAVEERAPTYLALGSRFAALRHELLWGLFQHGVFLPPLVHPSVQASPSCQIGEGAILFPGCLLGAHVIVGQGSILFHGVVLEHDTHVASNVWLAPRATTSGLVRLGANSFIGAGAVISCEATVGERTLVGAGAVVVHDTSAGAVVYGCPARAHGRVRSGMDAPTAENLVAAKMRWRQMVSHARWSETATLNCV